MVFSVTPAQLALAPTIKKEAPEPMLFNVTTAQLALATAEQQTRPASPL